VQEVPPGVKRGQRRQMTMVMVMVTGTMSLLMVGSRELQQMVVASPLMRLCIRYPSVHGTAGLSYAPRTSLTGGCKGRDQRCIHPGSTA
jgi:hypothetical protein